jgi:hypothetical protein
MSAKHTSGPWNVVNTAPNRVNKLCAVFDRDSREIAMLYKDTIPFPEQRANARLIGAAPKLLVALLDACQLISTWRETGVQPSFAVLAHAHDEWCAVIAEAEGVRPSGSSV